MMRSIILLFVFAISLCFSTATAQGSSKSTKPEGFLIQTMLGWGSPDGTFFSQINGLTNPSGAFSSQLILMYSIGYYDLDLGVEVSYTSDMSANLDGGTQEAVQPFSLFYTGARGVQHYYFSESVSLDVGLGVGYGLFSIPAFGESEPDTGSGLTYKFSFGLSVFDVNVSVEQTDILGLTFGEDTDDRIFSKEVGMFQYLVGYTYRL